MDCVIPFMPAATLRSNILATAAPTNKLHNVSEQVYAGVVGVCFSENPGALFETTGASDWTAMTLEDSKKYCQKHAVAQTKKQITSQWVAVASTAAAASSCGYREAANTLKY